MVIFLTVVMMDGQENCVMFAKNLQDACMDHAETTNRSPVNVIQDGLDQCVIALNAKKVVVLIMDTAPNPMNASVKLVGKERTALSANLIQAVQNLVIVSKTGTASVLVAMMSMFIAQSSQIP